jgi:hypothetical protein
MTPENFCYWLQGIFEVGQPKTLDEFETQIIKNHLELVFKKETPSVLKPVDYSWVDNQPLNDGVTLNVKYLSNASC